MPDYKVGDRVYLKRDCPILSLKATKKRKRPFTSKRHYPVIAVEYGMIFLQSGSVQAYVLPDEVKRKA